MLTYIPGRRELEFSTKVSRIFVPTLSSSSQCAGAVEWCTIPGVRGAERPSPQLRPYRSRYDKDSRDF